MRRLLVAALCTLAAAAQELPRAVDLVQRIDQLYPWLEVAAFDLDAQGNIYLAGSPLGPIPDAITTIGLPGSTGMIVIKFDPIAQANGVRSGDWRQSGDRH
jgi:hypothetical protein